MDNLVIYRFKSSTGQIGAVATVVLRRGGVLRWAWDPGRGGTPRPWDLTDGVQRMAKKLDGGEPGSDVSDALTVTVPYLGLLNVISAELRQAGPGLVQFGIIQREWPDHEELVSSFCVGTRSIGSLSRGQNAVVARSPSRRGNVVKNHRTKRFNPMRTAFGSS